MSNYFAMELFLHILSRVCCSKVKSNRVNILMILVCFLVWNFVKKYERWNMNQFHFREAMSKVLCFYEYLLISVELNIKYPCRLLHWNFEKMLDCCWIFWPCLFPSDLIPHSLLRNEERSWRILHFWKNAGGKCSGNIWVLAPRKFIS